MDTYLRDIFYKTSNLTVDEKIQLCKDGIEKSYKWWVDVLKPGKMAREKIDMSLNDILSKLDETCHFVIIHRRGYTSWNEPDSIFKWHLEIGFSTMYGVTNYLFIEVNESEIPYFVDKYRLTSRL